MWQLQIFISSRILGRYPERRGVAKPGKSAEPPNQSRKISHAAPNRPAPHNYRVRYWLSTVEPSHVVKTTISRRKSGFFIELFRLQPGGFAQNRKLPTADGCRASRGTQITSGPARGKHLQAGMTGSGHRQGFVAKFDDFWGFEKMGKKSKPLSNLSKSADLTRVLTNLAFRGISPRTRAADSTLSLRATPGEGHSAE